MANMPQQKALLATIAQQVLTAQVQYAVAQHATKENMAALLVARLAVFATTVLRASTPSSLDLPPSPIAFHVLWALTLLRLPQAHAQIVLLESTHRGLRVCAQIALLASTLLQLEAVLAWTVPRGAPVLREQRHVVHAHNFTAFLLQAH
jgi:hypothetical protein